MSTIVIFKDCSCKLKTRKGFVLLRGMCSINTFTDSMWNEIMELNPEVKFWIDRGYLVVNSSTVEKVAEDKYKEDVTKQKERSQEATKKAKETVKNATLRKGN